MHLIRLLSVSDTFTAGEIPVGRYHVVGLKVLPRFRSSGLAVRTPVRPVRRWQPVAAASGATGSEPTGVARGLVDLRPGDPGKGKLPVEPGVEVSAPGVSPAIGPVRRSWWRRGVLWLTGKLKRSRNPFHGSGMRVARTVRPRQGVLGLESMRVVCNELKDSDFGLVSSSRKPVVQEPSGGVESVACDFQGVKKESAEGEARLGGGML